eukprot:gb/GECH01003069.1/.p1 GENE.gb/GECH01003069.1/~~gb/GECH01003069.1/.p1  ORF type:complete len:377 (+),score=125.07 gb/GECH01003069.1/:1-1131(+)
MGIKGLAKLLDEKAPRSLKEEKMENMFNRKIAIDASMSIYQFLIGLKVSGYDLANDSGEVTSHIQGLLNRTVKMLDSGIKPVFVFDGKPPEMKSDELEKRNTKATDAKEEYEKAREEGTVEDEAKFAKRTVRMTTEQSDECKRLLKLLGVPIIEAPSEAEAQCAELCKQGKVWATATDDMDALTFGTPILLRRFTFSGVKRGPLQQVDLDTALEGLDMDMDQFIDMCILCGCDYTSNIKGIGPKSAYDLIKKHKSIENVLQHIKGKHYVVPEHFPFEGARKLFKDPEVTPSKDIELKWSDPDTEGVIKFLVEEKQFNRERVEQKLEKLKKSRSNKMQNRLESFFGPVKKVPASPAKKRKREDSSKGKPDAKRRRKK